MKILHIIGSMDPASGGPCQGIRNSSSEMIHQGVYREVVSLDDPNASFLGIDDFPIYALGPTRGKWQYTSKLEPWLMANIHRFDVVILNGIWLFSSYMTWKVIKTAKKNHELTDKTSKVPKLFVMLHGMLDPYFQKAKSRRLKALRNWFYWKLIEHNVINDADGILFTCEAELLLARQSFSNYHPKKEINVGYGIMPPPAKVKSMYHSFAEKCLGLDNQPYLLFLSRIHEKKGLDLLINAYLATIRQAPVKNVKMPKLVIAGPGLDTPYGKKMFDLVTLNPETRDSVFFTGMLSGDAKWGALYNCDAFILPSHQENFGISVVEALACQKPTLITYQINIWMEIINSQAGIVDQDTQAGVQRILDKWLSLSPTEQTTMGKMAFAVFERYFQIGPSSASFLKAINFEN